MTIEELLRQLMESAPQPAMEYEEYTRLPLVARAEYIAEVAKINILPPTARPQCNDQGVTPEREPDFHYDKDTRIPIDKAMNFLGESLMDQMKGGRIVGGTKPAFTIRQGG